MKQLAITLFALGITASAAAAETVPAPPPPVPAERTWSVGGKLGYLMSGDAYVDSGSFEGEVETGSGAAVVVSADAMVAPRLSVGGFAFAATPDDVRILTFGGTIKARFHAAPAIQIRPGAAVGYQTIDIEGADSTKGFDLGAFVEVAHVVPGRRLEWLLELGFITQPSGGNADIDLSFGPIFYVAGGVGFGN
jgi:hypothetical protein